MKRVEVDYSLCTGCRLCEIACSLKKEGSVFPETSRIRVHQFHQGLVEIPVVCAVCSDCPSHDACPPKTGAISRDNDTLALKIDETKCIGTKCGRCAKACRVQSAINFHPRTGKALVCDVCDGEPECVKVCPTGALSYQGGSTTDGRSAALPTNSIARLVAGRLGL